MANLKVQTPYDLASEDFEQYAHLGPPALPGGALRDLQIKLCRWEQRNFGAAPKHTGALGVSEELGELAERVLALMALSGRVSHATLKAEQGIRGTEAEHRQQAADAIADMAIFAINLCTKMRIDFGTLLYKTADQVMRRDWKARPLDAHEDGK
jgi:NTP pyrophosphatase (non-canonical NTP hydrolase)